MDLVSSIRKSGSRGGVNFSWDEVAGSSHRENYLGHSLMAPVGRWQKGKDLSWYAKADGSDAPTDETDEERAARERHEEIKRIKEAEEDALAKALGLPPPVRTQTGANSVEVGKPRMGPEQDEGKKLDDAEDKAPRRHRGDAERRHRRSHRSRSRSRDRRRHRSPQRGGERDGRHRRRLRDPSPRREPEHHHRRRDERLSDRRERTHDADRKETRPRRDHRHRSSRSPAVDGRREDGRRRRSSQSPPPRRRSRSPGHRERP